jgi:hypothetical protein
MGWKFISGEQAEKKTKTDNDVVRFIVGQSPKASCQSENSNSSAIVKGIATFLETKTKGLPKEDRVALEARLHIAITKILTSRD